jgi:thymidylate synthase (FAD)
MVSSEVKFRSDSTVKLIQNMGGDHTVVMAARVSSGSEAGDEARDKGLINYLMRDRHGSPFESAAMTFYIESPIFVFREFMRHRIASYNEESGRYKQLSPVFYIPNSERPMIQVGKPGAYTFEKGEDYMHQAVNSALKATSVESYKKYVDLLSMGVAREVARMVLPLNIFSSMYVSMNARSLMNFLSLRSSEQGTFPSFPQEEIAQVAAQMENIFKEIMPETHAAFVRNGRVSP